MLSATALNIAYGNKQILQGVDVHLRTGEFIGLIGPNGSGKTTLIRCLSGILVPVTGSITLNDKDLWDYSERERAQKIAVVPQSTMLPPAFTVFECVALGRTPHLSWLGHLANKDLEIIQRAMESSEVAHLSERCISELSGGEQQRVQLARALAQDCSILLLDEPTAHLDLHHQVALLSLVRRMVHVENLSVLVAMHDLNLASLYADRLMLLVEGQIRASGSPAEVLTTEILQGAYQVPVRVHPNPQNGSPWIVLKPF